MNTIDQEVGMGLAYLHARNHRRMNDNRAWDWATKHWPEFLHEMDTETGQLLVRMARFVRTHDFK